MSTERIDIYGGKATIKQNKFDVWQFRMWVNNKKRYYEKSLRNKRRIEAIDKVEDWRSASLALAVLNHPFATADNGSSIDPPPSQHTPFAH